MRRLLPRTLFGQLVLGILLVQTLLLGIFISYTVVSQRSGAEARVRQRIVQQLDRLSEACSKRWVNSDVASLNDVLELSRVAPTIEVARLTDLNGTTLAVSANGRDLGLDQYELASLRTGTGQRVFKIGNGQLEGVTPVLSQGRPVALLWLEPNHDRTLNTLNTVVRVALTYGGFALLANILPIFFIVRSMTKPLSRLREATHQVIQNPDLHAGFPLPVTTTNEAGDLTRSFNAMVRELEQQRGGLLDTLALLDSLLGNAPIGFAFFDPDLRYVRLNRFLAEMFEIPFEEHLGRRVTDLLSGSLAAEMEARLAMVFATGDAVRNVELSGAAHRAPGSHRSWLMHFYPVRTKQDTVSWVGVIAIEITERLKAEESLRKTEKLATAGRLAASIAHEINNPLEAVTNLLYLLRYHEPMDPAAMEFVATAQAELARISEITQQTLRFHRQSTSPGQTNILEVLDSILKLYQPRIASAEVNVIRKYRCEPEVFGFGGELRQVFANLIGNALDAMPGGGLLLLRARRGTGRRADGILCKGVCVSVTDTGTGMSKDTLQKLFEAFFTTKQATGTGLGLWISEEIVRKHSGTIRVRSRMGQNSGTTFVIFIPDSRLDDERLTVKIGGKLIPDMPYRGNSAFEMTPPGDR